MNPTSYSHILYTRSTESQNDRNEPVQQALRLLPYGISSRIYSLPQLCRVSMSASDAALLGLTVDLSFFSILPPHLYLIILATCLIICYTLNLVTWTETVNFVDGYMWVLVWSAWSLEPDIGPDGAEPERDRGAQAGVNNHFLLVCALDHCEYPHLANTARFPTK